MNLWQMLRQIRYRLSTRDWSGSSTQVFPEGAVVVSQLPVEHIISAVGRIPVAVIRALSGTIDPDHRQEPDILRRQVAITIAMGVEGDRKGEDPLLKNFSALLSARRNQVCGCTFAYTERCQY